MARTLSQLQQQYNTAAADRRGMFGGRRGPGAGGPGGKPKDTGKTARRLLAYLKPYRLRIVVVLLCMLVTTVASLIASYLLAPIIDRLTLAVVPGAELSQSSISLAITGFLNSLIGEGAGVMKFITAAVILLACVYAVEVIASYTQSRLMVTMTQKVIESIRNELFEKLEKLPVRYFDSRPTGEIMSRFTNDVDNISTMISSSLTSIISGVVTLVGTLVFMLSTSWVLTLVTVVFLPIFTMGGILLSKISRKYYKSQQAALGAVNGYIEEMVTGQKVVKVFNHEDECIEEFGCLNDDLRGKQFKATFWGGVFGPIMGNTSQISYAVTVGLGGVLMVLGKLSPGGLTVFSRYSRQFSMPINQISQQMTSIFSALAGAERVFEVMDMEPEAADAPGADPMTEMKGYVVVNDVSFGYVPEKTVLKHISLYAKPGQKIAFVGSTGAGKTTITNLLNRFYEVGEGSITIDGVDIRNIRRDELRSKIAMVLQDTHLFSGTVMENIRYGRLDATDEEVIEAAKTASAHSFIMKLSDGYQTKLEGDGTNLSQGQRQLLNIARAAISRAPILVLDEATSSVDTRTERHIEEGLSRLMADRTTFVIAHRLSTVRNANAIMVLEQGEIIERGTHDELLAMKGRYYELYTGLRELD